MSLRIEGAETPGLPRGESVLVRGARRRITRASPGGAGLTAGEGVKALRHWSQADRQEGMAAAWGPTP